MTVQAIVAISDDNVIGRAGTLPWKIPEDMARFKERTMGHAIIMGRATFESMGSKPLKGRKNIVVSKTLEDKLIGSLTDTTLDIVSSPEAALKLALSLDDDPFIIGGAKIYRALWNYVDKVHVTRVHTSVDAAHEDPLVVRFDGVPNTFLGQVWKGTLEGTGKIEEAKTKIVTHYGYMLFERRANVPVPLYDDMKPPLKNIFDE